MVKNSVLDKLCNKNKYKDEVIVSTDEVVQADNQCKKNKSSGPDGLTAEHLMYGDISVCHKISRCLSAMLVHAVVLPSLVNITLVPIIKDKNEDITSRNNYRPIALATVISKVLERILL